MATVIAVSKRFWLLLYFLFTLVQNSWITNMTARWATHWWVNRTSIVMLTGINTAITTTNEALSREISSYFLHKDKDHSFLVRSHNGVTIHRQSLINIFMTVFASLLGGPVYFISTRSRRLAFFLGFGLFNSFLAQSVSALFLDGFVFYTAARLTFDLVYTGIVRFWIFEWGRTHILRFQRKVIRMSGLRVFQDFLTTFFRVVILNVLGFKG